MKKAMIAVVVWCACAIRREPCTCRPHRATALRHYKLLTQLRERDETNFEQLISPTNYRQLGVLENIKLYERNSFEMQVKFLMNNHVTVIMSKPAISVLGQAYRWAITIFNVLYFKLCDLYCFSTILEWGKFLTTHIRIYESTVHLKMELSLRNM